MEWLLNFQIKGIEMGTIIWLAILGIPLLLAINYIHRFFAKTLYGMKQSEIHEIGFIGVVGITTSTFFTMFLGAFIIQNINANLHRNLLDSYGMIPDIIVGYIISVFIYSSIIKIKHTI